MIGNHNKHMNLLYNELMPVKSGLLQPKRNKKRKKASALSQVLMPRMQNGTPPYAGM